MTTQVLCSICHGCIECVVVGTIITCKGCTFDNCLFNSVNADKTVYDICEQCKAEE